MTLYEEIKQHFHIPTAFQDWTDYRNVLTDYLIKQTEHFLIPLCFTPSMEQKEMQPTLLIIGAGACNDLDLSRILPHFSHITLLDNNQSAMEAAVSNYHLEHHDSIRLCVNSLNGLTDEDYRLFCRQLSKYLRFQQTNGIAITQKDFDHTACAFLKQILKKYEHYTIPLPVKAYDFVWCFGVHSQLQAMFSYIYHVFYTNLLNMYPDFSAEQTTEFENLLKKENDRFIPIFHDTLLQCARQKAFIGLEACRTLPADAGFSPSPIDETPIEGACQGIMDLQNRTLNRGKWSVLWPFHPARNLYYQMQIEEITLS
ncbi:MAG: hypothetical protein K2L07_09985 [Lachnospiraceae bacterium]|nr:hypothetical protein [Lachnospiraceae bacterium]